MPTNIDDYYARSPGTASATPTNAAAANAAAAAVPKTTDAVASTAGSSAAQAANAAGIGYNAEKSMVDEATETSAGQLNKITSQDSPLMQRAKAAATQQSNARGLMNSSIAAGAAQGAMVDRATPLAQQDAATYSNRSMFNTENENKAREFGAGATNVASLQNAQNATSVNVANAGQESESSRLNAQLGTNVSAQNASEANKGIMQQAENAQRTAELNAQLTTDANRQNAQNATSVSQSNAAAENAMRESVMQQNAELNRQLLAGQQSVDLATIQGRYQQLIQSNESAGRLYEAMFSSISAAMANENLPPDRIASFVATQQNLLNSGLALIDSLEAIDLTGASTTAPQEPGTQPGVPMNQQPGYVPPPSPYIPPVQAQSVPTVDANIAAAYARRGLPVPTGLRY